MGARVFCLILVVFAFAASDATAQKVRSERFVDGLTRPLEITHAPGDLERILIVEKDGIIKVCDLATRLVTTYLDLTDRVSPVGEGGLLGLAFHPAFESNGYLFVNYTRDVDNQLWTIVERYQASSKHEADPATAHPVISWRAGNIGFHYAGWMSFGPNDRLLYVATGDGAQRSANSQDLTVLLGKMLRVDVDGDDFPDDPERNYAIPADNPFADVPDALPEIWALGLRNPWRNAFDPATGDLYIADVGERSIEELNFQPAASAGGENYGWPCYEGSQGSGCEGQELTFPIHEYDDSVGRSIIGGEVYRGCGINGLGGTFFFADAISDRIWSMRVVDGEVTDLIERTQELEPPGGDLRATVSFGTDGWGEIYFVQFTRGEVFRIIAVDHADTNANGVPDACECRADVTGSSDPRDGTYGEPDGDVDSDDFFYFLDSLARGDLAVCDIDNDGDCDADDFFGYLSLFALGC